ncbi:hypothetical protein WJX72_009526 [[Myrmecia] bisecta]|uniref:RNA-binding protein 25 n=1 Tax=[Myrmecia] bisecta TaxID=41462 RepID=A0AAW1QS64_9CHLO
MLLFNWCSQQPVHPYGRPPFLPPTSFRGPVPPFMPGAPRPNYMVPPGQPTLRPANHMTPPVLPRPPGGTSHMSGPAVKSTLVWVGKIGANVTENTILGLLEACGPVKSWKRSVDPDSQRLKGFGFCEFAEASGVLRAMRLLNKLSLDGQELVLKCNSATERYVEDYQARLEAEAQRKPEEQLKAGGASGSPGAADADMPDAEALQQQAADRDAAEDNRVLEQIMSIISEVSAAQSGADAQQQASEFLSSLKEGSRGDGGKRKRDSRAGEAGEQERQMERDFERERQRQRKAQEQQGAEQERRYKEKLKDWERYERERAKERERERERQRDLDKERQRQVKADLETPDPDDLEEPWKRKRYGTSRRAEERRRRRMVEAQEDDADCAAELQELEQRLANGEQPLTGSPAERDAVSSASAAPSEAHLRQSAAEEQAAELAAEADLHDPIYQAMIADQIPADSAGVFSYPIKWAVFDAARAQMAPRISSWVNKKIAELLGEEEKTLVDFVMGKLSEHAAPAKVLEELAMVLDEEAETFVLKLYRMVIFETQKQALLGS